VHIATGDVCGFLRETGAGNIMKTQYAHNERWAVVGACVARAAWFGKLHSRVSSTMV